MSGFERLHRRLEEKHNDVTARPVIYVALGDSVTQGCMEHNFIEHNQVFHQYVKQGLEERYPRTIVNVINSGVSGDTASSSEVRWQRDLLLFQPDLVTIGFGVNDAHEGLKGLEAYIQSMRKLIGVVRTETDADLLIVTPNMMLTRENHNVHRNDLVHVPQFLNTAKLGYLHQYVTSLRKLIDEEQLPCVDFYQSWERWISSGGDIHSRLANGINHPDRRFHHQLAEQIISKIFD